jgi:serine/threonine protein kinase
MPRETLQPLIETILDLGLLDEAGAMVLLDTWLAEHPSSDPAAFLRHLETDGAISARQARALQRLVPVDPHGCDTVTTEADPVLGQRFGDYVARAKLGEGGMGVVYKATRAGDATPYVVKLFYVSDDPEAAGRIAREGEIMASLQHPNILRLYETGTARGRPYLILEYVEGQTLQELIEQRQRLKWTTATRATEQIAQALQLAHESGIVHRDVKPHNVLIDPGGTYKLCDFGLAKAVEGDSMRSRAGQILGSPAYIAPEQWGDHEVDERADLFALGVIYYQLLTGVTPFRGRTAPEYAIQIRLGDYDAIERLAPDVPPGVRALVAQLLERDRRYRTPSATSLLAELQRVLRGQLPDVPRLTHELTGGEATPLLGKPTFAVGSAHDVALRLTHPSVLPQHALLRRTPAGLLLSRASPQASVRVNDQLAGADVVLKDGDVIVFGEAPARRYQEGNLAARASWDSTGSGAYPVMLPEEDTAALQPLLVEPVAVPGVLAAALEDCGDPLALLLCIEGLDGAGNARQLARSRERLRAGGLDEVTCDAAHSHARQLLAQRAAWLADQLFYVTHENLGDDVEAWVGWWLEARLRYDQQVRPPLPRAGGALIVSAPDQPAAIRHALNGAEDWTIGRSLQADVSVSHPSLSRKHARIHRLISRLAFRDQGSRLGIRQAGVRREVGLLDPTRPLDLGSVRIVWDEAPEPPAAEGQTIPVDRATFSALVELRSPSTTRCLINLLDARRLERISADAVGQLGLRVPLEQVLGPFLEVHRALALEGLPAITRENLGDDVAAWRRWWRQHHAKAPAQVAPAGWGC